MTVGELIAALQAYDPALVVVVDGYEGGYDDPELGEETIKLNVSPPPPWYEGRHEGIYGTDKSDGTPVLVIGRTEHLTGRTG